MGAATLVAALLQSAKISSQKTVKQFCPDDLGAAAQVAEAGSVRPWSHCLD